MHEYFSSEDFNLRNPTKFGLHFSHFSLILYEFCKFHSNQINKSKPTPTPTDLRAPPAEQQREPLLLCSAPAARRARARRLWVRGAAREVGAHWIEARRRWVVGATPAAVAARSGSAQPVRDEGERDEDEKPPALANG